MLDCNATLYLYIYTHSDLNASIILIYISCYFNSNPSPTPLSGWYPGSHACRETWDAQMALRDPASLGHAVAPVGVAAARRALVIFKPWLVHFGGVVSAERIAIYIGTFFPRCPLNYAPVSLSAVSASLGPLYYPRSL